MTTPAAQIRWALVGLLLCSGLCVFAPAASAADESNQPLEDRLQSTDPGVFAGAILEIKRDHAADIGRDGRGWLRILMDRGKYTDVEDLCLLCILQEPANVPQVEFLQQVRVRALLKAGKPKEALAQAKALFNVCSMKGTEPALKLVTECLRAAYPNDPAVIARFRHEQIAGLHPLTAPAPEAVALGTGVKSQILADIPINPAPYEKAIDDVISNDDLSQMGKANLLLLSGRPAAAADIFTKLLESTGELDIYICHESLARAMRAQDGTVGRANAYVIQVCKKLD